MTFESDSFVIIASRGLYGLGEDREVVESLLDEQADDAVGVENKLGSLRVFVANEGEERGELVRARQDGHVGGDGHCCVVGEMQRAKGRGSGRCERKNANFPSRLSLALNRMAGSRYAYVRAFELEDTLLPSTFLLVRLDGKGFHAFSKAHNFDKPNDANALALMNAAARRTMQGKELQGECVLAIGESDEFRCIYYLRRSTRPLTWPIRLVASSLGGAASCTAGERGKHNLQLGCQNDRSPLDSTANYLPSSHRSSPPRTSFSGMTTSRIRPFNWTNCRYLTVGQSSSSTHRFELSLTWS